jgi:hypothetical protein
MLICKIEDTILCVKKNQLNAQLILSIFHQPLHVLGVSTPIIRRYNRTYITIGAYYPFLVTTDSLQIWIISSSCCIHTVVLPDDGPRYA